MMSVLQLQKEIARAETDEDFSRIEAEIIQLKKQQKQRKSRPVRKIIFIEKESILDDDDSFEKTSDVTKFFSIFTTETPLPGDSDNRTCTRCCERTIPVHSQDSVCFYCR